MKLKFDLGLIAILAIMIFSLFLLVNVASYYVEVYRAIYGVRVSVLSVSYSLDLEGRTARVNVILSIGNPSNREVVITSGEGRIYLNQKYLGSFMLYVGEGIMIAPGISNFTVTGISMVEYPYFNILNSAVASGNLSWYIEAWVHLKIGLHVTVVKCIGEL